MKKYLQDPWLSYYLQVRHKLKQKIHYGTTTKAATRRA